jgi:hypothetical protein
MAAILRDARSRTGSVKLYFSLRAISKQSAVVFPSGIQLQARALVNAPDSDSGFGGNRARPGRNAGEIFC